MMLQLCLLDLSVLGLGNAKRFGKYENRNVKKHGAAIKAFFVVLYSKRFLVDLTNAMIISILANIFK
ncbi:MAG: hypothetical protein LBS81_03850 [Endomicrobium sp.]|jgi:hypothetical protein|nr:hypothetical protein [Endomicrobium sp.]